MNKNNKLIKNAFMYVKYPYTALIISVMWISIAIIISVQQRNDLDVLVIATSVATLIIAFTGLKTTK